MPIQVSCPQCQKSYSLPDEKRGKQIRCKDCFQVFHAGTPDEGAAPSQEAPAAVGREPTRAVRSTPKPKPPAGVKTAPKPPAAVKTAPKPAAKPAAKAAVKKAAPTAAPQSFADLESVSAESPTTAKYRRRKSGGWFIVLTLLFLLLLLGGGATVGVLAYLGKLPVNLAALGLPGSHQAAVAPSDKDGAGDATLKPDNPDTPKPDNPDKPKDPPAGKFAASVTKENFDKIDRGMAKHDLFALMGPPNEDRGESFVWNGAAGKIIVTAPQDKVISKGNSQTNGANWPVVYPGDVAVTPPPPPPPDKPAPALTKENFDKIAKGMAEKDVAQLLGSGYNTVAAPGGAVLSWTAKDLKTGVLVTLLDGKVVNKASTVGWPEVWPGDVVQNPPADKPGVHVTQADFLKIAKGMALDDLKTLLGGPPTSQTTPLAGGPGDVDAVWVDGGKDVLGPRAPKILVTVRDGKVTDKASVQGWPIFWPPDVAQNPAPPDKIVPGLTQANFDRIAKGMTRTDVEQVLGKHTTEVAGILYWRTDDRKIEIAVTIKKDGKVAEKIGPTSWPVVWPADVAQNPPADKPKPGVTQANFDRVAKGMTLDDLTTLLGAPPTSQPPPVGGAAGDTGANWVDRVNVAPGGAALIVSVTLRGGKVIAKNNFQNWAVVWPAEVVKNPPAPLPPPALTKENFDKIDKGMPAQGLFDMFGKPPDADKVLAVGADVAFTWTGPDGKTMVKVVVSQGKVASKQNNADWPIVYPSEVVKNPPPPAGLTQALFDKIDKGMSADELFRLLGKPPAADDALRTGKDAIFNWMTADGNSIVDVTLSGAKVTRKGTTATWPVVYPSEVVKNPPPPPDKPAGGVAQANFDKIDKGMTEDALTALLGPPAEHHNLPPMIGGPTGRLVWRVNGKPVVGVKVVDGKLVIEKGADPTVVVDLMQGKVFSKSSNQDWPIVYPSEVAKNPPAQGDLSAVRATKENFDKIAKGMSEDELAKLLGGPWTSLVATPGGLAGDTDYLWVDGNKVAAGVQPPQIMVTVRGGKVFDKKNFQNWAVMWPDVAVNPPPDKPDPAKFAAAVTKNNFDKIAKGMSKDALMDLFGPPVEVKPQPQPGVDERLIWQGAGGKIMVGIAGGKVVAKLSTQDWPVIYPK